MRGTAVLAAISVVCAVAVLPACGGGDRLSHRELDREATMICRRLHARVAQIQVPSFSHPHRASDALERVAERGRNGISHLRDLNPSKADAANVDMWIAVLDQILDEVMIASRSLRRGDAIEARDVMGRAATLDGRGRDLTRALGVGSCRVLPKLSD